ncbi:Protein AF-9 like protein [Cucumispora dikerogammari]|nr:Protein AF-9 like protein [Cucumispora dikerogammari]
MQETQDPPTSQDRYIGFPIIIGSKAIRQPVPLSPFIDPTLSITYKWEFYVRSVYTLPYIYGLEDFEYNQVPSAIISNIPTVADNTELDLKTEDTANIILDSTRIGDSKSTEQRVTEGIKKNTLDFIDKIIIHLHSSFPEPIIEIPFSSTKAAWDGNEFNHKNEGWGEFEIRATIIMRNNRQIKITHFLKLHVQEPNSRIIPDHLITDQPENVVISERFETIILKNPGEWLMQSWGLFYSDVSTLNIDMEIEEGGTNGIEKQLPSLNHWFRNKKYGDVDDVKIDKALKHILDLIENSP